MTIWYGEKKDTTDFTTENYLEINSCGFQNISEEYTVIRKKGRSDYHILLISSGICEVFYKDKNFILNSGDFVVYAPKEEQKYTFKTESTSLWCHFSGTIVEELFDSCQLTSGVYFSEQNKSSFETFSRMIQRFHQSDYKKFANASLIELIYQLSDARNNLHPKDDTNIILPILTYINFNYNKQITIDELAQKSGYSKSRFSHIFSALTGTTPIKYQNDIRLKTACEMLLSTNHTVSKISFNCGFNDPLYFSRLFKKKYGITPTEYRQ